MQEQKICPYPGLRPFTEEESIFFKGRDKHIEEIIHQAEEKKFVMLTGASGDGKSSIVYAGVIPQARAGFFKAKYNNWLMCTFRPERTAMKNMTDSVAKNLQHNREETEKELSYGFSALIDLYTSSSYYINEKSDEWKNADEKARKQLKRKGANLFILVDQFEEFFTNPENYNNGKASVEAQTVVNLLLETAKIALAEDIPIYIICTMRSDYIGQCAAFRNLPEFIGFSQFFVPRLKRKEIYDVIEEPAILSGNSISKRLIEVLVNDLREGFDQLPVLQHALNQVWKKADSGYEEMDIIHLAKVCGMPSNYLPNGEKVKFTSWYNEIMKSQYAVHLKVDFETPSLENVLNAHSNELFEKAHEYYTSKNQSDKKLLPEQVKFIIKKTFQCLTKIDDGRAVRNRMTLQEITDVINDNEITVSEVNDVINIFREQGNTLIYPFINEDSNSKKLDSNTVLDITHESLIRNWEILKVWTDEENENYENYLDFKKQLDRWIANNKEKGYLLPIGPYTFFMTWYDKCNPNNYWLVKYDDSEINYAEKLKKAENILSNTNQFLKQSARKLTFNRFILKYGANKLLGALGIIALICSCTYFYFDFRDKQNENVLNEIIAKGKIMLKSKLISSEVKTHFVINATRLSGSFHEILDSLHNDTLAFDIAFQAFCETEPLNSDQTTSSQSAMFSYDLFVYIEKCFSKIKKNAKPGNELMLLKRSNQILYVFSYFQSFGWGYGPFRTSDNIIKSISRHREIIFSIIKKLKVESSDPKIENSAFQIQNQAGILNTGIELFIIQNKIDYKTFKVHKDAIQNIDTLIFCLSPFESTDGKMVFESVYPKNKSWHISEVNYFTHNGGYQMLAYLYAARGEIQKTNACIDSIIKNNSDYKLYQNENFYKILTCLQIYKVPPEKYADVLKKYEKYSGLSTFEIINFSQEYYNNFKIELNHVRSSANDINDISAFNIIPCYNDSWDYYQQVIYKTFKDENDLNFNLALYYKKYGIFTMNQFNNTILYHAPFYTPLKENYFKIAFDYYSRLPENYLNEEVKIKNIPVKRSSLFLFPVIMEYLPSVFEFNSNRNIPFLDFILKEKQYCKYFKTKDDFELLDKFICYYSINLNFNEIDSNLKILDLIKHTFIENSRYSERINENIFNVLDLITMIRKNEMEEINDSMMVLKLKGLKIIGDDNQFEKRDMFGIANSRYLQYLANTLSQKGYILSSGKVVESLSTAEDKINTLTDIVYNLQLSGPIENTFIYMDTLFTEIDKSNTFGLKLIRVMSMIGSKPMYDLCIEKIKNIDDKAKPRAMLNFIRGVAFNGFYYSAYKYIPEYVSSKNELEIYNEILHIEVLNKIKDNQNTRKWKNFDEKYGDSNDDFVNFN